METIEHVLFHYNYARAVWFKSHLGLLSHHFSKNCILIWWNECCDLNRSPFGFDNQFEINWIRFLNLENLESY